MRFDVFALGRASRPPRRTSTRVRGMVRRPLRSRFWRSGRIVRVRTSNTSGVIRMIPRFIRGGRRVWGGTILPERHFSRSEGASEPMGANRARIGARRAPPEGRSRVVRGSSRAVRGYCTLEEEWPRVDCGFSARFREGYSGVVRVGRVGLVGLAGAGACPNLPQRRPGPGSAANETAEYQRFFSRAPARSGPLWQIWTTGAAAGPSGRAVARLGEVHDVGTGAGIRAEGGRRPGGCPVRPRRPRPSASAGPAQAPRSARSPLNRRERLLEVRSRGLPGDLGG